MRLDELLRDEADRTPAPYFSGAEIRGRAQKHRTSRVITAAALAACLAIAFASLAAHDASRAHPARPDASPTPSLGPPKATGPEVTPILNAADAIAASSNGAAFHVRTVRTTRAAAERVMSFRTDRSRSELVWVTEISGDTYSANGPGAARIISATQAPPVSYDHIIMINVDGSWFPSDTSWTNLNPDLASLGTVIELR